MDSNHPAPAEPADMAVEQLQHIIHREPWATWLRPGGCLESAHCELTDLLRSAIAADRANHSTPARLQQAPAPVDLDALLSPAGPYETGPDAGNAAGAQLVTGCHGPIWWAPKYGCDSLDYLLHQIGARILPHLRPPVIGVDVPGPDGDWGDIADLCQAEGVDVEAGARLLRRVRAAWHPAWYQAQPTPPAEGEAWSVAESLRRRTAQNPMGSADPTLIRAAELLERLAGELATLRQLAEEILALVSESTGVAGLHLNGDIAPWDELLPGGRFERLTSLPLEDRPHG